VVFRLSGTGSQGATVRMYVERYLGPEAGPNELGAEAAEGLKGLIEVALEVSKLKEFLGRDKPTVITVSSFTFHENIFADCFTFQ
jgi:phosphoglucomutase